MVTLGRAIASISVVELCLAPAYWNESTRSQVNPRAADPWPLGSIVRTRRKPLKLNQAELAFLYVLKHGKPSVRIDLTRVMQTRLRDLA